MSANNNANAAANAAGAINAAANAAVPAPVNAAVPAPNAVVENIEVIKNAMKSKFAGKTRREKAALLKEVLNAVAAGAFVTGLAKEAEFQATKPPGDRAKRIAAFMNKEEEIELFGGRRRKASRKAQRKASRKSRKASRKAQRKSRKATRK